MRPDNCSSAGRSSLGSARASPRTAAAGNGWRTSSGYLDGSRRLLAALLAEHLPGIGHQSPEGTYLDWLDCRDLFRDRGIETSPAEFFLAKARVLLTDGVGRGHVRLNFATPRPIFTEIVHRMAEAVCRG